MKVISKKICTVWSTMAVINTKERTFWPILNMCFVLWLHYVENNWNSVLIIISYNSLICICSIRFYDSISFNGSFSGIVVWKNNFCRIRKLLSKKISCLLFTIKWWELKKILAYLFLVLWHLKPVMLSSNSIGLFEAMSKGVKGNGYCNRGSFRLLSEFNLKFLIFSLVFTSFS